MKFLISWLTIALAVAVAVWVVPGVGIGSEGSMWWTLLVAAAVLGLVNATLGAVLKFLALPFRILTLGLFSIVINALMLMFSAWLSNSLFGTGLYISGFWSAVFASILISIVTTLLSGFGADSDED
jgi:putative membrane protein